MGSFRRLLFNNSVTASKVANCMAPSDHITSPLFRLKWSRRSIITSDNDSLDDVAELPFLSNTCKISEYRKNVLFYIAGFVVRKLRKSIACDSCLNRLYFKPECAALTDHGYYLSGVYARFFNVKNKGGLIFPAVQVYQVICICDSVLTACVVSLPSLKFAQKRVLIQLVVRKVFERSSLCKYFQVIVHLTLILYLKALIRSI